MIVCVTGGKGGPGATVLAVRLARALVRREHSVLLVDLDPLGGDMGAYLNSIELDPRRGLLPLLKLESGSIGPHAFARELQPLGSNMKVLLGFPLPAPDLLRGRIDDLLRAAGAIADVVVADLGRAWPGSPAIDGLPSANRVVVAARADLQGALAAERTLKAVGKIGRVGIAATRTRTFHGADVVELSEALGRDIRVALPDRDPARKDGRRLERALDRLIDHLDIDVHEKHGLAPVPEAVAS